MTSTVTSHDTWFKARSAPATTMDEPDAVTVPFPHVVAPEPETAVNPDIKVSVNPMSAFA